MVRKDVDAYDRALGLRESEYAVADAFAAELPLVTGRPVEIIDAGESPDRIAVVNGTEVGIEFTSVKAGTAQGVLAEIERIASRNPRATAAAVCSIRGL